MTSPVAQMRLCKYLKIGAENPEPSKPTLSKTNCCSRDIDPSGQKDLRAQLSPPLEMHSVCGDLSVLVFNLCSVCCNKHPSPSLGWPEVTYLKHT